MSAARVSAALDPQAAMRKLQGLRQPARRAVDEVLAQAAADTAAAVRAALPAGSARLVRVVQEDGIHQVIVEAPDLRALEFGTRGQAAGPVLRPAAAAAAEHVGSAILAAFVNALKAGVT